MAESNPQRPRRLRLDSAGLPLIPQPSDSPFDPLNYPTWLKCAILLQVSILTFLATMNIAIVNPAVVPLSQEFHISHVAATYQATIAIGVSALGPLLFTPVANVYGRRPVYLITILIGFVTAVGAAQATSYGGLIAARAINGFGTSSSMSLGAGTVVDLFFVHQRGKAMGVFTLMLTNGAHLAPIIGGYVARDRGWRWCIWVGAILNGIGFLVCLFLLPETLFDRSLLVETEPSTPIPSKSLDNDTQSSSQNSFDERPQFTLSVYLKRLWLWDLGYAYSGHNIGSKGPRRKIRLREFIIEPMTMLKYPSVTFPALYYAVSYGYASFEPGLTMATLFTEIYNFNVVRNGLANGVSLLVGASLGELCSGPVTDSMMQRARRRAYEARANDRQSGSLDKDSSKEKTMMELVETSSSEEQDDGGAKIPAEVRLQDVSVENHFPLFISLMVDLLDGLTIHFETTFIAPCIGVAIACFGIAATATGHEVTTSAFASSKLPFLMGNSFNTSPDYACSVFRQLFGLPIGFYAIPFGREIGFALASMVFAIICLVTFIPVLALMFRGAKWRKALGEPKKIS
ncbi:hypothetical protein AMATHDRAFT_3957 [Amanita thiersii Skay4041]|uniref:Major facilitator superfamily (MFS) profile domain-containing protein n=1 Tax=Amanita thiersii Skay4041 TaxID=703135 RepID=A0A2A9NMC5_9AGAR|nr:hypothetical protein AMATHDRAFT_3957 [Amanita thiersii Skay4041]